MAVIGQQGGGNNIAAKRARIIARVFVDVPYDLPEWRARAPFLKIATAAFSGSWQVISDATIMDCSRGSQRFAVRTEIDVALGVVGEVGAREHTVSSLVPLPYGNMRCNAFVQEPGKHLTGSIGCIGGEPFRLRAEHLLIPIDHGSGCGHLVIGARWRCLDVDNDGVLYIDNVVETVAKLYTLVRLCRPRRAGVRWRYHLRRFAVRVGVFVRKTRQEFGDRARLALGS